MSLQQNAILNSLHPYLRFWVDWIDKRVVAAGGVSNYLSGFRTDQEQLKLWRRFFFGLSRVPAARPGCSQHNYGSNGSWAVDVRYFAKRPSFFSNQEIRAYAHWLAQTAALRFVRRDPNHLQIFHSAEFLTAVKNFGRCRDRGAIESG